MKSLAAFAALTVAFATTVAPAFARDGYVVDDAHLLKPETVSTINQRVGDLRSQSGKEVLFVSTPSLGGQPIAAVAERAFAQNQVNGVLIFVAKAEHRIDVVPDRAGSRFFPGDSIQTIRGAMAAQYKTGDYDGGTLTGVSLIINTYRSHLGSRVRQPAYQQPVGASSNVSRSNAGGFNMGWIWWIIILAVIFFVIRGIFRAMAGPRMMPPGYGGGGPGYGGGGYGPGYGGGMGGGGGGFFSGLLGGLGGAFLGNELFGRRDGGNFGNEAGVGGDGGAGADNSGFQNDAGQADMSNASSGDFGGGDSGGGWGGGGGGGDWGGGGGDSGGGGGGGDW